MSKKIKGCECVHNLYYSVCRYSRNRNKSRSRSKSNSNSKQINQNVLNARKKAKAAMYAYGTELVDNTNLDRTGNNEYKNYNSNNTGLSEGFLNFLSGRRNQSNNIQLRESEIGEYNPDKTFQTSGKVGTMTGAFNNEADKQQEELKRRKQTGRQAIRPNTLHRRRNKPTNNIKERSPLNGGGGARRSKGKSRKKKRLSRKRNRTRRR